MLAVNVDVVGAFWGLFLVLLKPYWLPFGFFLCPLGVLFDPLVVFGGAFGMSLACFGDVFVMIF